MTRYKQADFVDEDTSSIGTIQLNETSGSGIQVRYKTRGNSLWKSLSKLEKILLSTCFTLTFCLLLVIFVPRTKDIDSTFLNVQNRDPCLTEPCIHAASSILNSIDRSIDPCDDFYSFSCNQWIAKNPLPDGKSIWGTFGKLEQQNQIVIKNYLEKPDQYFTSEAEKKAKFYYESCMDEDGIVEKLGAEPMKKFIKNFGGWNITDSDYDISSWTLEEHLKIQNRYNMNGFFTWGVAEDDKNSSRNIISIDQGGLNLPTRDHYLNKTGHEKVLKAYLDYMTKVAVLLGANENEAKRQMQEIIDFETEIAQITAPLDERRNDEKLYNAMTLRELQIKAGFIDWVDHFSDAFSIVNRTITNDEPVVVYAPEFFQNLSTLIIMYKKTSEKRTILANYLVWQAVRSLTSCLSKPFREAYKGLRKALVGSEGSEEPWRYCVSDTHNVLGFAIGAMFVRGVFHGESKPAAELMINQIREAFIKNLKTLDWMDKNTSKLAEEKANAITDMIGFPDYILNKTKLDERYFDLKINKTEYFDNNIRVNIYNLKKNLEKLNEPVNKTTWGMTPPTVNAYYAPTKNQIVFPAGILQLPFYDLNYPRSLNFGGMGVVMGHELTHSLDDQGREYDKFGNLKRWWENKSIDDFNNKTKCFIEQYEKYQINGKKLNGKRTLGENIADNGGLKAAYHAFLNSKSDNEADILPLPGLNMTHKQLFFIAFAQVWCTTLTSEAATLQVEKDNHTPPKYRVIGTLSNFDEFSREFNCKLGTNMNPQKKCEVW
ncbi:neprilysin-3 isoform X2 [Condylostylus longicornis]|nr:neprilysin-3 isoform X2 [Condylostylus longicornis]XP_055373801.1 neprilysin-3 isoform X2 [Condylostylus longicornis]